jgi:hypothetical protein
MSAATILAEIDAAISAIVTGTASAVSVNGTAYSALNLDSLRELRSYYAGEAARETALAGTVGRRWACQPLSVGDAK